MCVIVCIEKIGNKMGCVCVRVCTRLVWNSLWTMKIISNTPVHVNGLKTTTYLPPSPTPTRLYAACDCCYGVDMYVCVYNHSETAGRLTET